MLIRPHTARSSLRGWLIWVAAVVDDAGAQRGCLGAGDHGLIGGEEDYMRAIRDAPYLVRLVKVFDRINNLQCIHTSPQPGKAQQYVEETLKYHLPLASEVDPSLAGAMRHAIDQL